jgi:hypothetical protein
MIDADGIIILVGVADQYIAHAKEKIAVGGKGAGRKDELTALGEQPSQLKSRQQLTFGHCCEQLIDSAKW